ncbi:MAG: lipopolysaccharide biosynthesis protein [Paludibacteraceae bacterium]
MKEQIRKIARSELVRNSAKLLSANVIAQAIGLLVYPILTRLYSPEDFGLLNLFLSIGGVLVLLSTAEYQYAIVLPKKDEEARGLVHICVFLLLITTGIVLLSVPFSKPIARLFNTPELANWYWLMPLFVLVMGLWNILNYWYIRRKAYSRISGYQIGQSILSASGKLGLGTMGYLQGGMIITTIFAPLVSISISILLAWKKHIRYLFANPCMKLKELLKQYRNFPVYSLPRSVINMVAGQLPVLLLTPMFGTREIGFWSMAILLAFSPISMVTRAIYQVLYQHVTTKVNTKQKVFQLFRQFTIGALSITIPCFSVLYFFLPQLCQWLLGSEWSVTGEYIRWMLPWLCCNILTSSIGFLYDIFFKQQKALLFEILMAVLRTMGVLLGMWSQSFRIAVAGYAVGSAVAVLAQYIWLISLVKHYDKEIVS